MKNAVICTLLVGLFIVTPAYANYMCSGAVTYVGVANDGTVTVGGPGGLPVIDICQMGTTSNGFTPDSCKAVYATLLAAKLSGQSVTLYFDDSLTCSTQPAWTRWASMYFISAS